MRIERPTELCREAVVPRLGGALDDGQVADAVETPSPQPGAPRETEHSVVGVEEPGEMIGPCMSVADRCRQAVSHLALERNGAAERARVLEVLVEHEHVGIERSGRRGQQLTVVRWRAENGDEGAVPEDRLAPGPVGASAAGQV